MIQIGLPESCIRGFVGNSVEHLWLCTLFGRISDSGFCRDDVVITVFRCD